MKHTPDESRRSFLRGVLLAGTAAAVAPSLVAEGLVKPDSALALIDDVEGQPPRHIVDAIIPNLIARVNAHIAVTGEPPKLLLVNRMEIRALYLAMTPLARYTDDRLAKRGVDNLLVKGVPVASVDNDTVMVSGRRHV